MRRKTLRTRMIWIIVVMISSIGMVSFIAWDAARPPDQNQKFVRKIQNTLGTVSVAIPKPAEVSEIVGFTKSSIFFRTKNPSSIYVTDINLQNPRYWNLPIQFNDKVSSLFRIVIDSPSVKIFAGNAASLIVFDSVQKMHSKRLSRELFTNVVGLPNNSFALRMYDGLDQIFGKGNTNSDSLVKEKNISARNGDAGLLTDGSINYDIKTNQIVYIQYFNSEILCLDTNLRFKSKFNTIDASKASFKVGLLKSKSQITAFGPKRLINSSCTVSGGFVFVISQLSSVNEPKGIQEKNSVIDLYSIVDNTYLTTFYCPLYEGQKIRSFMIIDNRIVTVGKNYLVSYKIPNNILKLLNRSLTAI